MKTMKKLLALTLALAMVLSLSVTAFAEGGTFTIKTAEGDTHTYEVYQIFTGDLADDGATLSNVKWGQNAKNDATTVTVGDAVPETVLTELSALVSETDNQTKLDAILKYADLTSTAIGEVTKDAPYGAAPGYYLIKDKGSLAGQDDAYTTYVVQVVKETTITRKAAQPTVDKQVLDETTDAEEGSADGWGETADHAINESFQFKLTAQLPNDADLADYESYKVVFTDTMSNGVTFESIESVKVGSVTLGTTDYTCTATAGQKGGNWTLTIADLLSVEGITSLQDLTVEVIYNAHLNEDAVMAPEDDNQNKVYLEYSNNPNVGATGDLGKTPVDTVFVFTYAVPTFKYTQADPDADKVAKEGAGFKLYDSTGATEIGLIAVKDENDKVLYYRPIAAGETAEEMFSDSTGHFDIHGLDIGTYVLKETTTPDGYNTAADTIFVVGTTTNHAENADEISATVDHKLTVGGEQTSQVEILNSKGVQLPSTGGIGTTIFYIVGGLLTVGAVILLVTKKKMSAAE